MSIKSKSRGSVESLCKLHSLKLDRQSLAACARDGFACKAKAILGVLITVRADMEKDLGTQKLRFIAGNPSLIVRNHCYMINAFDLDQGNRSLGLLIDGLDTKLSEALCGVGVAKGFGYRLVGHFTVMYVEGLT